MFSVNTEAAAVSIEPDPPPKRPPPSSGFLWTSLFADSTNSNTPSSSPSFLEDGTPVVLAPKSVLFQASSSWAGHLICRFLGEPPSPAKFFNDLNRIWGKFGDITVRRFSSGVFLVHVPSSRTRQWILQTGLWSSGTVSFVVSEWTVKPSLAALPKLTSATTVLTIREIPPQLWSHEAVARIAGGVAKLIPGTRASLPLSSLGTATIRVIVPLGSPLPPSVLVKDEQGDSVLVSVSYGRLPHLCPNCKSFGHLSHRCPLRHSPVSPSSQSPPLIEALGKQKSTQSSPNIDTIGSVPQQSVSMDIVSELSPLNAPLITSPQQVPEMVPQAIEIDHMDCEKVTSDCVEVSSDCVTDPTSLPNLPPPLSDELNQTAQSSPLVVPQSMEAPLHAPAHVTEVAAQVDEIDSMAEDKLNDKSASDSPSIPNSSPSLPSATQRPNHSSSKDELQPVQLHITSSAPSIPLESLEVNKQFTSSHNDSSSISTTEPDPSSTSFSYPPLVKFALDPKTAHISTPQIQLSSTSIRTSIRQKYHRGNSKDNPNSNPSLRCKTPNHQFKPQGILEKRKKRAQNELIPDAEEKDLNDGIQAYQFDKKETTYYEALKTHKILRRLDHGSTESQET